MKQLIFKVTQITTGHEYSIYSCGHIEGFPDDCVIHNYHSPVVDQLRAKLLIDPLCPTSNASKSLSGNSQTSDV